MYLINKKMGRLIDCNPPRDGENQFKNESYQPWDDDAQKQSYNSTFESLFLSIRIMVAYYSISQESDGSEHGGENMKMEDY